VALVRTDVPPKCRFLQEPHVVTSQKMAFFIVTAVKASNLHNYRSDSVHSSDTGQSGNALGQFTIYSDFIKPMIQCGGKYCTTLS
jgi:hypothetical protein